MGTWGTPWWTCRIWGSHSVGKPMAVVWKTYGFARSFWAFGAWCMSFAKTAGWWTFFFGSGMVNPSWFLKIGGSARTNGHFCWEKRRCVFLLSQPWDGEIYKFSPHGHPGKAIRIRSNSLNFKQRHSGHVASFVLRWNAVRTDWLVEDRSGCLGSDMVDLSDFITTKGVWRVWRVWLWSGRWFRI